MAIYTYHYRFKADVPFDQRQVYDPPTDPRLARFTEVIWYGRDDEGWCVYRRDPLYGRKGKNRFRPAYNVVNVIFPFKVL
jgi:hypothetical protein